MYEKKYKINKATKVFILSSKISKMSNNDKFTLKSMLLNPQINHLSSIVRFVTAEHNSLVLLNRAENLDDGKYQKVLRYLQ